MYDLQKDNQSAETLSERAARSYVADMNKLEQQKDEIKIKTVKLENAQLQLEEIMNKMPQDDFYINQACDMKRVNHLIDGSKYFFRQWIDSSYLEIEAAKTEQRQITRKMINCEEEYKITLSRAKAAEQEKKKY